MILTRFSDKKKLTFGLVACLCASGAGLIAARTSLADFNKSYVIGRAASIYVTPRGQEYFSSHEIMGILQRNGIDLTHNQLDSWAYDAPAPFDLAHLPAGLKPYQATLNSMRGTLRDWLIGFNLANPVFHAKVREAGYELQDLDLGLHVDPGLTREYQARSGPGGVAVIVEATIPHLKVHAKDICGYDSANPMLGNCSLGSNDKYRSGFGLYHPWVELRDNNPLKISVPTYLQIQSDGSIEFSAVNVTTNLDQLNFASGQDRGLLLPTVQLQVGTRTSTLNQAPLAAEITRREHELVVLGIHHLQDFIVQELPARLNTMAFNQLKQGFAPVKTLDPPGVDVFHDSSKFEWGLRPSALGLFNDFLFVDMAGYVVDPDLTWDEHLPVVPSPRPPTLGGMDAGSYDFAFAINTFVAQRVIWLAYNRGALPPVSFTDKDGKPMSAKIVVPPLLSNGTGGKARLHVYLQFDRDGSVSEWWALKDPFVVELYLDVKLQLASGKDSSGADIPPNSFDLVVDNIDTGPGASTIQDQYIDHSKDTVLTTLHDDLVSFNAGNASNPRKLTDTPISFPANIFNLPLNLSKAEFDPNGYMVLYMSYGDRNP